MPSPSVHASPRASVVIPVYDRLDLTRACVEALTSVTEPGTYELIVVDNASSDGSEDYLRSEEQAGTLRHLRNDRNLGFATACNQGAATAAADVVVFLNNDTIPTSGWLDALVAAVSEPGVGAAGARLLYPDGTVQHAGMELMNGIPDHPFRFAAADHPAVVARRDLDMVTGACLAIRRSLFERLGGFDSGYVNGVEDVDLCLRVREAGYRVRYEPASVVYHLEGQSQGRFDHVRPNLVRFAERWGDRFGGSGRFVSCVWRGDTGSEHSLAVVNDGHAQALARLGLLVERTDAHAAPSPLAAIGVAAHWPPDFTPASSGPFVLYQPWEFGEIPASWAEEIRRKVDEVWTPSEYSRQAFLAGGVAPELVHVVPNGVDLERFSPDGPVRPLSESAATVFLFVGGTTYRKGIDLLLAAYGRAFSADDDVLLAIKGFGADSYYRGQTAEEAIAAFRARPDAPRLLSLDEHLAYDEIPALYRAADCVVQPYRGEGFCLPALEALACGRPVIATAGGPTDEFASDACAWRVRSRRIPLPPGALAGDYATAGEGFLLEPELDALVDALRAAANPDPRAEKAAHARAHAERFSWDAAAEVARGRLQVLAGRTPIRTVAPAAVPGAKRVVVAVDADWEEPSTWTPALDAYAAAFGPDDPTTLVLPAADEAAALARVNAHLDAAALDAAALADIVLADAGPLDSAALELAADAYVCSDSHRPVRARRLLPPEPDALRSLLAL